MGAVLVTGGAGFIGSHIVDLLIDRDFSVIVLDNESTGNRQYVNIKADFVHGDVQDNNVLETIFAKGVDFVIHIAGQASISLSFFDPTEDLSVNTIGTINIIQKCIEHRVKHLLFASSMTIYGTPTVVPTPEDAIPNPVSYYAVSKYAAERYVHISGERKNLDFDFNVTSFRMFNVYGPRQSLTNSYQGVLAIFLGNVLRNEPINIHSDGEQSRDFVHVSDVARAWVDAIGNPQSYGQVFNIGTGNPTSVNQLCDNVLRAFDYSKDNYEVVYHPAQAGDIRTSSADIEKIESALGWSPQYDFEHGMQETIRWARQNYKQ